MSSNFVTASRSASISASLASEAAAADHSSASDHSGTGDPSTVDPSTVDSNTVDSNAVDFSAGSYAAATKASATRSLTVAPSLCSTSNVKEDTDDVNNGSDNIGSAVQGVVGGAGTEAPRLTTPDYVIELKAVTKEFRRSGGSSAGAYTTFKSRLLRCFSGSSASTLADRSFKAISNLTIRIPKGASVGVIGRNGSGKSTLLKLITGIYRPTSGNIRVGGRVSALIELGAGFHPDFTGRENILLGGIMQGLSRREIRERLDDIIDFAELREVIDEPVRTYSSGMFMRLGFSLAIHTDPQILLIDEVLAVGDAAFVARCKSRLSEFRRQGKTLLVVSHDLEAVERWCDEAVWLERGVVRDRGEPRRVIDHYRQFIESREEEDLADEVEQAAEVELASEVEADRGEISRWGSRELEITSVAMIGQDGKPRHVFHPTDQVHIVVTYKVHEVQQDVVFGFCFTRGDGVIAFGTNTDIEGICLPPLGREGEVHVSLTRLGLLEGTFRLDVAAHRSDGYPFDYHQGALKFSVRGGGRQVGVYLPVQQWAVQAR